MTSGPRADHPDIEALDAHAEGDHADTRVARHVAGCADCHEVVVSLQRVRVDLSRLERIQMPPDVAERLAAALSDPGRADDGTSTRQSDAELSGSVAGAGTGQRGAAYPPPPPPAYLPRPADPKSSRPGGSDQRRPPGRAGRAADRRRRRFSAHPGWLVGAAAAVAAIAIGVSSLGGNDSSSKNPTSAAAGSAGAPRSEGSAAGAPVPSASPAGSDRTVIAATGAVVTTATVGRHANDLVGGRLRTLGQVDLDGATSQPTVTGSTPRNQPNGTDEQLQPNQASRLTGGALLFCYSMLRSEYGGDVLAVDEVVFQNRPAVVVTMSVRNEPTLLRVVVLDPACNATNVPSSTLYTSVVRRG